MPDWVVERGIGETRFALLEADQIIEARILLDGILPAGTIVDARLVSVGTNGRNALAVAPDSTELLLPHRPAGVAEGALLRLEIVREAIPGTEPWKRPLARPAAETPTPHPSPRSATIGELDRAGWSDLLDEAATGLIDFRGGQLRLSLTPAMCLLDVDGTLPPDELAVAGARAAAHSIRRFGVGGSIGIDLPTTHGKAPRAAAAAAIDAVLAGVPFERTAVNGFGFVQIVRPRRHASLPEIYAGDRAAAEARALLRRACTHVGALTLAAHPAVIAALERQPDWTDQLARQVGGAVALRSDPRLAISAGHAEPS
ncbi:ribonuclease [Sphingomonas sp. BN140010]|uniref:Ribonuclease n=1 Tax=Sphingomonas arvum TaxID=2992113 RepID=A0ABT3JFR6_9SPHN|nr:ribonuclease [Sphingomonas sp. BN140010]MCW3797928.1 ribonuclease [Sphingomonas sp. BN140010]